MGKELGNIPDLDCVQSMYSGVLQEGQTSVQGCMYSALNRDGSCVVHSLRAPERVCHTVPHRPCSTCKTSANVRIHTCNMKVNFFTECVYAYVLAEQLLSVLYWSCQKHLPARGVQRTS